MHRRAAIATIVFAATTLLPSTGTPGGAGLRPAGPPVHGAFVPTSDQGWEGRGALEGCEARARSLALGGHALLSMPGGRSRPQGLGAAARVTNRRMATGWERAPWHTGLRWPAVAPGVELRALAPEAPGGLPRLELVLGAGASLRSGQLRLAEGYRLASALAWRPAAGGRELRAVQVDVDPAGWVVLPETAEPLQLRLVLEAVSRPRPVELAAR